MSYLFLCLYLVLALRPAEPARPYVVAMHPKQATVPDCRAALFRAVHLLQPATPRRAIMHLQFTSHTYFQAPGQRQLREVSVPATLYAKGRQLYFATPQTIMHQDEQHSVVIMPAQQTLYLTRTPSAGVAAGGLRQFALLQDSLVARSQVLQCQTVEEAGKHVQQVVLSLSQADRARYGVTTLGFKLDAQGAIREVTMVHPAGRLVSKVVYTIEKQEFLVHSARLSASTLDLVVDKRHQPLPAYHSYRVVDHTQLARLPY